MTDLRQSLLDADLSLIRAVAESWGLSLTAPNARQALEELVSQLLAAGLLADLDQKLSLQEKAALIWLDNQGGREPWDHFTRRFGELREVGPGSLEREAPHRQPVSAVESLWYKALIGRGFIDSDQGPIEYAFLPQEVIDFGLQVLNPDRQDQDPADFQCRVASPKEIEDKRLADLAALNHITTLLAASRIGINPEKHLPRVGPVEKRFYQGLLVSAGLLDSQLSAYPEQISDYFELARAERLEACWNAWRDGSRQLELSLIESFEIEGEPEIDLPTIRRRIIEYLGLLKGSGWWSLESFIYRVKEVAPDFLRLGGDYDAWFIRDIESGEYLKGFQHWDAVEGELIRFLITGPMYWLGMIDLGAPEEEQKPLGFRLTPAFGVFLSRMSPDLPAVDLDPLQIRSKGEIRITDQASNKIRYQVSRFCDWGGYKADAYLYTISPGSLKRAEKQGLKVAHLLTLLKNHAETIPPNLSTALKRWEKDGLEVQIRPQTVMRLGSPAVLKALQKSPAGRYIDEQLGPTVVVIRPGSAEKVSQALMELGFLVDWDDQAGSQV